MDYEIKDFEGWTTHVHSQVEINAKLTSSKRQKYLKKQLFI